MKFISLMTAVLISINMIEVKEPEPMTIEDYAEACEITVEEFELISSVVEAESDRSDDMDGRIYIALTILNRVESELFPDTIIGVLTQRGQFSTVRRGRSIVDRTELSDQAVLYAFEWIQEGDAPKVLFFNCRYYFSWRPAYEYHGGNYFSL